MRQAVRKAHAGFCWESRAAEPFEQTSIVSIERYLEAMKDVLTEFALHRYHPERSAAESKDLLVLGTGAKVKSKSRSFDFN